MHYIIIGMVRVAFLAVLILAVYALIQMLRVEARTIVGSHDSVKAERPTTTTTEKAQVIEDEQVYDWASDPLSFPNQQRLLEAC